jgi:dienelactone hydrolase
MKALLLLLTMLASPALAETAHFPSATTQPTPLQQRLARERGTPIEAQPTTELIGKLYRPPGNGPFPAIVALHGCNGRGSKAYEDATAARFTAEGYALLFVDSFRPRGLTERCNSAASDETVDRVMDAYGGLTYLAGLPFIDPSRIALVGYSQGAIVALSIVASDGIDGLMDRHFKAAIAYYPSCRASRGDVSVPTLVLIGALDDWTPAAACQAMMARRSGEGAPLRLVVYPGAYHAFDAVTLRDRPLTYQGHHIEYNEAADRAAWTEAAALLRQVFGR